jgi:hypothetical protein
MGAASLPLPGSVAISNTSALIMAAVIMPSVVYPTI